MRYVELTTLVAVVAVGALLATAAPSAAADPTLIPRVPGSAFDYTLPSGSEPGRVVLKFAEGSGVRRIGGGFRAFAADSDGTALPASLSRKSVQTDADRALNLVLAEPAVGDPVPLFAQDEALLATLKANGERATGRQQADLGLYFSLPVAPGTTYGDLQELLGQLNALGSVEVAYAEPMAQLASAGSGPSSLTPDFMQWQIYLFAAPLGIDAPEVWRHNQGRGGRGEDVKVVDVEGAWRESHEDLPPLFYQGGSEHPSPVWEHHGTAVLGQMGGVDNGFGVHGIADEADYGTQSIFPAGVASAIMSASGAVGEGGIVVLEVQVPGPPEPTSCWCLPSQCDLIPPEYYQAEFDAISLATANCVTVVEAGGNGAANLDSGVYGRAFDRSFRDSGAIFVAASLAAQRIPACFTNQGSRMDFHAWGEFVVTTGYGDLYANGGPDAFYTRHFSGTSSATPIIAGAAAAMQGAQLGYGQPPLAPEDVLAVLRRGATASAGGMIGPMPNLRNAVTSLPYNPRVCLSWGEVNSDEMPDQHDP